MKTHRRVEPADEQAGQEALYRAILDLRTTEECRAFFSDLCTPAELQAMTDRWRVAELLDEGLSYRQVNERTGVSLTTIGRVARYLTGGAGGYAAALHRTRRRK